MPKCLTRINQRLFHVKGGKEIEGKNEKMSESCSGLRGDCSGLRGECSELWGECSGLWGECSKLRGDCSELSGNLDNITEQEREDHNEIGYWIK